MADTKSARLVSLDLLRGLDMLLLTVVGPFFTALNEAVGLPDAVMRQFHHAWGGFTLWDLIMPLFIFMCGAAVPFALGRRLENGRTDAKYWIHVAKRFALLWFLGMVAQGRLLTLDLSQISFFDNTLQTIACGYLVAAIALPVKSRKVRIALPMVLALAYAAFLHFGGDYSQTGNAAAKFETARYFDTANFATLIGPSKEVTVGTGFIDTTCPPDGVYAAFNAIPSNVVKRLSPKPLLGHGAGNEYGGVRIQEILGK